MTFAQLPVAPDARVCYCSPMTTTTWQISATAYLRDHSRVHLPTKHIVAATRHEAVTRYTALTPPYFDEKGRETRSRRMGRSS